MGTIDTLRSWITWEDPLLFLALILSVVALLIKWAFRTADVPWRVRIAYQFGIVSYVSRGYLIRSMELERGWATNLTLLLFIVPTIFYVLAVVRESGLVGKRRLPPGQVK